MFKSRHGLVVAAVLLVAVLAGSTVALAAVPRAAAYAWAQTRFWYSYLYAGRSTIVSADIDANGKADLVSLYDNGNGTLSLKVFKSTGSAFSNPVNWYTGSLYASRAKIAAGDVNGDGKDDILMLYDLGSGASRIYAFTAGTTSFGASVMYQSGAGALAWYRCKLSAGDVDANGKDDAIVQYDNLNGTTSMFVYKAPAPVLTAIRGSVRDAVSNGSLGGVTVIARNSAGTQIGSATSASDGSYSLSVPAGSGFTLYFTAGGYLPVNYYNVGVTSGQTRYLETVYMVGSGYSSNGVVSGTLSNAFTGAGLDGVTIYLRSGMDNRAGTVVASGSSTTNGSYVISGLPGGVYTAQLSKTGYTTTYITVISVGGSTKGNQNGSLTPNMSTGQWRIVLTWGSSPSDLDSHLTGPMTGSTSRFHVYYGAKTYTYGGNTIAQLDVDDRDAYGPETTTIYSGGAAGTYRFTVYNWSGGGSSSTLGTSGAKVQVYTSAGLYATFNVPTGRTGGYWTVFEIRNGSLVPINTVATTVTY